MWKLFENFQENALKLYFKKINDGKQYLQFVLKNPLHIIALNVNLMKVEPFLRQTLTQFWMKTILNRVRLKRFRWFAESYPRKLRKSV